MTVRADRLAEQLGFVLEVDRLKSVLRRGYVADGSRYENTAEHSWTLALMAIVLAEHAAEPVDVSTVVQMVLIHDLVEVDVGDTYVYDDAARAAVGPRPRPGRPTGCSACCPPARGPSCGRCGTSSSTATAPRRGSPGRSTGSPGSCSTTPARDGPGARTASPPTGSTTATP
jgi:hypothetical protein